MIKFYLVLFILVFTMPLAVANGDLEPALNAFIEAIKSNAGLVAIILAFVQILKTRFVLNLLAPMFSKLGIIVKQDEETKAEGDLIIPSLTEVVKDGVNPMINQIKPVIKGSALPYVTLATGILGGIAEAKASGRPVIGGVVNGVISSGGAMIIYDLIKPIISKK
jgi:membrane protease YdiL (CAAX protease family)